MDSNPGLSGALYVSMDFGNPPPGNTVSQHPRPQYWVWSYSLPDIIRMMKPDGMSRLGRVARLWVKCIEFWWGNLKERNNLEDLGVAGR